MPGHPDVSIQPTSSAASPVPSPVVNEQPRTEPRRGTLSSMVVACCPEPIHIGCQRLGVASQRFSNDPFAMNLGFGVGYAMGLTATGAGALCGVFVAPPMYIMGAVPAALTGALAASHIGCCVHYYCKTVADIQNVMGPETDQSFLVIPEDITQFVGDKAEDAFDGAAVTQQPEAVLEQPKDERFDELYQVAQWVTEEAKPQEISSYEMPGDREGLIIDHNPEAAKKTVLSAHNDYLVIDHS